MPKGLSNKNMRRLNMHLENQISRAKYINPNRKVMLSQAEQSNGASETRASSHTTGSKAGEPGVSPSSAGLDPHPLQLPPRSGQPWRPVALCTEPISRPERSCVEPALLTVPPHATERQRCRALQTMGRLQPRSAAERGRRPVPPPL